LASMPIGKMAPKLSVLANSEPSTHGSSLT
jgi:hypothetical protein